MKSRRALIRQIADENGFVIRQLYQHVASARGHFTVVGSAMQIGDILENWFTNESADGFNILPPGLPTGLSVTILRFGPLRIPNTFPDLDGARWRSQLDIV